jgi:putative endonuclease
MGGFVHIMANKRYDTIYVGVTSDLIKRVLEHKNGVVHGFTKRDGRHKLV